MFKFITDKPFWVNLLVVIALTALLIVGLLQLLGFITHHGEHLTVPKVTGEETRSAIKKLESLGFEVEIKDSIYTDTAAKGTVLKQFPEPNSTVKVNRTIVLTVNRTTMPLVDMPNLEGKSMSLAIDLLIRSHLTLGDTTFKPDFMKGSVLEQTFKGNKIAPGTKLPWGSSIDLLIGRGLDDTPIPVPDLLGMTYFDADTLLRNRGIMIGAAITDPDVVDSASAFIWRQSPPRFNELGQLVFIQPGQIMDVWLSVEMRADTAAIIRQNAIPVSPQEKSTAPAHMNPKGNTIPNKQHNKKR